VFKPVPSKLNATLLEEQILNFWKLHRIFAKASEQRAGGAEFVFYESPPTANRKPDLGHARGGAFQDLFLRYKQMRGYHVSRRGGWQPHGLPVELGVEKQLGLTSKSQIKAYGVERFNALCRKSAFQFIQEWERFNDRIAYWLDMQEAFVACANDYIESVWWILKTFWERGLLYQNYQIVSYCPRCTTPLAEHEVAQGYQEQVSPAVFVRLPLVDEPGTSLLVWSSAPWSLPGNVAVAAHPNAEYVTVRRGLPEGGSERLILAKAALGNVFGDAPIAVVDAFKGKKLRGKRYQPLFKFLHSDKPAYRVILRDSVIVEQGSGLRQVAPAFGAQDLQAALEDDLPVLTTIAEDGVFIPEVRPWSGKFFKDADPYIIEDLSARGLLLRADSFTHSCPSCCYCNTPLLSLARGAWYLRTRQFKERLVALSQSINWTGGALQNGCSGDGFEHTGDWLIGRERYWGVPLPIWECVKCRRQLAAGSVAELARWAGRDLAGLDLHSPFIDQVKFACPDCRGEMQRIPELLDVAFEGGAMPYAQWHYPFENKETFRAQYPADFVCEAVDQAHGWFYSLHTISALLHNHVAFKNALCLRPELYAKGDKVSKENGNRLDPWDTFNGYGADAFRWYQYIAALPEQARQFSGEQVSEAVQHLAQPLWEVYSFFVAHANQDRWQPTSHDADIGQSEMSDDLDRWLFSELNALVKQATETLDCYDVNAAAGALQRFVDHLLQWYLRRARRRFWTSELDQDKGAAYSTLYHALVTLSQLLAPFTPFLSEALYQNLRRAFDLSAPESVHLCNWPAYHPELIDELLNQDVSLVRRLAALGQTARNQAGIKESQPLAEIAFAVEKPAEGQVIERFADLLADELNVKRVRLAASGDLGTADGGYQATLQTGVTPELAREGLAYAFIRRVQEIRAQAECEIAERIRLYLNATPELVGAIQAHWQIVLSETLAEELHLGELPAEVVTSEFWFVGQWMKIGLSKLS